MLFFYSFKLKIAHADYYCFSHVSGFFGNEFVMHMCSCGLFHDCMYTPLISRCPEAKYSSCEDFETLELSPSVWKLVQQNCPEEEAFEVKRIVGESLIEESCDLYSEVSLKMK